MSSRATREHTLASLGAPGSGSALSSDAIDNQVEALRGVIERLVVQVGELTRATNVPMALSKRQAAQRLSISRGRTLDLLIQQGFIRTVQIGNRIKVPLAEIERLLHEGAPTTPPPRPTIRRTSAPRATRRPPNLQQELAKARALKVSDL